jgi:hypothetical protein
MEEREMNLKRIFAAVLAMFCLTANAAPGIYSGIWVIGGGTYVFVAHSGNSIIATTYTNFVIPNRDVPVSLGGQRFYPSTLDVGDLLSGSVTGNYAQVSGPSMFRVCTVSYEMLFTSANAGTVRFLGSTPTSDGIAQGVYCAGLFPTPGTVTTATRAF